MRPSSRRFQYFEVSGAVSAVVVIVVASAAVVVAVVVVVDVDDVNDDTPAPAAADVLCSTDNDRLIREGVE